MPKHEKQHFDRYTPQNQAKHQILGQYLPAYLTALKETVHGFHYIDGFAGKGKYEDEVDGSALLAMKKMDSSGVVQKSVISLVESNPQFFDSLSECILSEPLTKKLHSLPVLRKGKFTDVLDDLLNIPFYKGKKIATFAFIDPCGVEGVELDDIKKILNLKFGEVLLFFNYDAVIRLLGGVTKGTHETKILENIFGSSDLVNYLIKKNEELKNPKHKETLIFKCFSTSLKHTSSAKFLVPFRFEAKGNARTSHYLIHISSNKLAFCLMKHVMWEAGKDETDQYGKLEFLNDNQRGKQFELFHSNIETQKEFILNKLIENPLQVRYFSKTCVENPLDSFSEKVYKKMLLELEEADRIAVYDKANIAPAPAKSRLKRYGKSTLADDCWLRLVP